MSKKVTLDPETGSIKYYYHQTLIVDFTLDDVVAIGEVAADKGPLGEDHLLVFITNAKIWKPIPTDATGFDQLLSYVGSNLDITSFIQLANYPGTKSRIVYPRSLEGKEFMEIRKMDPKNFGERISMWLGLKPKYRLIALSEVYDKIKPQ